MAIRSRFSGIGQGSKEKVEGKEGQGAAPKKPPAPLRRLSFQKKLVKVISEAAAAETDAVKDAEVVNDRLTDLTGRVVALEDTVRELTIKVEEHEAEIDRLKGQVNGNGDLAQRMVDTTEEVVASLDRANGMMQALSAMLSTVIPLFQELNRPPPRGLFDALRRIQEEHDHIRLVVIPRALHDASSTELAVSFVDETGTRH